jgi:hypothetical protein
MPGMDYGQLKTWTSNFGWELCAWKILVMCIFPFHECYLPTLFIYLFINPLTYDLTNQMMTRGALKWPYNMSHFTISQKI